MILSTPSWMIKKQLFSIEKNHYENHAWQVQKTICGVDEVGRGCLAGPVVAAAVILPSGKMNPLLKDSKTMSESERNKAFLWIKEHCWYSIGSVDHSMIDELNIWHATLRAMQKATMLILAKAPEPPIAFVVDAMPLTIPGPMYTHIPIHHFTKGEEKSASIAAASIVAKVWRDSLIKKMSVSFSGYGFEKHKGYATKKHTESLLNQPRSLIHRTSFLKNIMTKQKLGHKKKEYHGAQQRLC